MLRSINNYILFVLCVLVASSCSDITNNIYVDKDGNVKTEISIEPHTFLPMDMMKDMMGDSLDLELEEVAEDEMEEGIMSKLFSGIQQLDTSFNLRNIEEFEKIKDSIPIDLFVEDILISYLGDTTQQSSKLAISVQQSKDQYNGMSGMIELMEKDKQLMEQYNLEAGKNIESMDGFFKEMEEMMNKCAERSNVFWDKGVFKISKLDMNALQDMTKADEENGAESPLNGMGDFGGMADEIDLEDEFTREMMTNMFGRMITKVHLPGKVEFTNDTTAVIDGNVVTYTQSFIEAMMDKKSSQKERIIKFKK